MALTLFIFYYGQTVRSYLFPNERDENGQLQLKLKQEHEEAQTRRALRKLSKELED